MMLLAALAVATALRRVAIFDGAAARMLLRQCSRAAPAADGLWRPSASDVAAAEEALVRAWPSLPHNPRAPALPTVAALRGGWRTEATGVTSDGRRAVYLSFVPAREAFGARPGPTIICDGGPALFGALVDLASGRVLQLGFNGVA